MKSISYKKFIKYYNMLNVNYVRKCLLASLLNVEIVLYKYIAIILN